MPLRLCRTPNRGGRGDSLRGPGLRAGPPPAALPKACLKWVAVAQAAQACPGTGRVGRTVRAMIEGLLGRGGAEVGGVGDAEWLDSHLCPLFSPINPRCTGSLSDCGV